MKRYLTATFVRFLFGFLFVIGIAFCVVIIASSKVPPAAPVDNVALPQ